MVATTITAPRLRQRRLVGEDDPAWFTLLLVAAGAIACSWSAAMWLRFANVAPFSSEPRVAIPEAGDNPATVMRGPLREWRAARSRPVVSAGGDASKPAAGSAAPPAPEASVRAPFPLVMGVPRILRQGVKSSEPNAAPCAQDNAEAARRPCPRR
ncbi:hypothetical protein [Methylocystis heyeri]|uniref:Uncharacterized protein n=1 Tax=Methylocystis heyeri TaxID=391905 RepID=A0A6B8KC27_9HYPH|nr:hypothetical protein [Methylocystis heyeri]QGM45756.1 hypothetical protein H2LOC_008600 [Methylocystis heyeri]